MNEPSIITRFVQTVAGLPLSRVIIVAVGLTAAYYFMMYNDGTELNNSINAAKGQLEAENKKKIETQKVLKKEQQMKADVEQLAKKFEEIKARIPIDFTESEMRTIVNQYATRNGLKTNRTERRTNPSSSVNDKQVRVEDLVEQIVLNYEFEGTYANIAKFVNEVSNLEKIIKISDFNLQLAPVAAGAKEKNYDLVFRAAIIGYKQSLDIKKVADAPAK